MRNQLERSRISFDFYILHRLKGCDIRRSIRLPSDEKVIGSFKCHRCSNFIPHHQNLRHIPMRENRLVLIVLATLSVFAIYRGFLTISVNGRWLRNLPPLRLTKPTNRDFKIILSFIFPPFFLFSHPRTLEKARSMRKPEKVCKVRKVQKESSKIKLGKSLHSLFQFFIFICFIPI